MTRSSSVPEDSRRFCGIRGWTAAQRRESRIIRLVARKVELPEGLRVDPNGTWWAGDLPVQHEVSLLFFKAHLVFEGEGAFVVDGERRMPVELKGPPFEVLRLEIDEARGQAFVVLDDGTRELLEDPAMDEATGRFGCAARAGRTRALLSRGAHHALLDHAEEEDGEFYLRVGLRRLQIRTG